jgi:cytochrome b
MKKSYIWSLPTRVFHALFVVFILLSFFTDEDKLLDNHATFGYAVLVLLLFRVYWGFFGPKYSKFKDFPIGKTNTKTFFDTFLEEDQYVGHNPLASYIMIAMFIVLFLLIISGGLAYGIQDGKGIFSFLNTYFDKTEVFETIHEFLANILIALIVTHLSGVVFDILFHKNKDFKSIVTGYKMTQKDVSIKSLSLQQKVVSAFMFVLLILFLIFNLYKDNIVSSNNEQSINNQNITVSQIKQDFRK